MKALRLEVLSPQVAFRDCDHCRKFIYDEKTGEPRKVQGNCIPRIYASRPPCERSEGCPKGHWSNPTEVKEYQMPMIHFCEAVRATSGACLTDAQRTEPIVLKMLVAFDLIMRQAEHIRLTGMVRNSVVASVASFKGMGV